jgi:IMP dehydrogenase
MAKFILEPSRTFSEYLLIPNLTKKDCIPSNVSLKTPIVKFKKGQQSKTQISIPLVSAVMQAVSDNNLAVALAEAGGLSFIFGSQTVEDQASMVAKVKKHKAGFVISDSNLKPKATLKDVEDLIKKTGHSTIAITKNGKLSGEFIGLMTRKDYSLRRHRMDEKVDKLMTPLADMTVGDEKLTLEETSEIIWRKKLDCLPILEKNKRLKYLVFRRDIEAHNQNPNESVDRDLRLLVGAGINSRDHEERVPALLDAGADVLCVDSSDGFSEWQRDTIRFIKKKYGDDVKVGGGNVVDEDGFRFLVESGVDFVKIGIGGGSICITREQKGIGRGQASALIAIAKARDAYFKETGIYIPLCSDGGIVHDYHITLALAMGADFVMMGRFFSRFDESPGKKIKRSGNYFKEYWAEGSNRARNWQRYDMGDKQELAFEEGVDSYVPYAGPLKENLERTLSKIKSTMCNCGAKSLSEFRKKARLTLVSSTSLIEGKVHDVILKKDEDYP